MEDDSRDFQTAAIFCGGVSEQARPGACRTGHFSCCRAAVFRCVPSSSFQVLFPPGLTSYTPYNCHSSRSPNILGTSTLCLSHGVSIQMSPKTADQSKSVSPKSVIPPRVEGQPPPPPKIHIIEDADATGETLAAYDYWRTGSGRTQVPGIIKCFGARPDFLRQVVDFSNTIHFSEGHLQRRHKEMIASYVSYLNRCPY